MILCSSYKENSIKIIAKDVYSFEQIVNNFIKLKHSTGKAKKTFVYRKPLLAKRRDINAKEIKDMIFIYTIMPVLSVFKKGTAL